MAPEERLELNNQVDVLSEKCHVGVAPRRLAKAAGIVIVATHVVESLIAIFHSTLAMVGTLHALLFHLTLITIPLVVVLVVVSVFSRLYLLSCVDLVSVVAAARVACISHFVSITLTYLLNCFEDKYFFKFILIKIGRAHV